MEQTGVSIRNACKIVNACMRDMGLASTDHLLDSAKLRRQRKYCRDVSTKKHTSGLSSLRCVGLNGRIDITGSLIDEEDYTYLKFVKDDHYVIVSYPENVYVDHVAPQTGRLSDVAKELISVVRERCSEESLTAVVCDGTNVNAGHKHGII